MDVHVRRQWCHRGEEDGVEVLHLDDGDNGQRVVHEEVKNLLRTIHYCVHGIQWIVEKDKDDEKKQKRIAIEMMTFSHQTLQHVEIFLTQLSTHTLQHIACVSLHLHL